MLDPFIMISKSLIFECSSPHLERFVVLICLMNPLQVTLAIFCFNFSGKSKGFCFVEYETSAAADAAQAMNNFELAGRNVLSLSPFISSFFALDKGGKTSFINYCPTSRHSCWICVYSNDSPRNDNETTSLCLIPAFAYLLLSLGFIGSSLHSQWCSAPSCSH